MPATMRRRSSAVAKSTTIRPLCVPSPPARGCPTGRTADRRPRSPAPVTPAVDGSGGASSSRPVSPAPPAPRWPAPTAPRPRPAGPAAPARPVPAPRAAPGRDRRSAPPRPPGAAPWGAAAAGGWCWRSAAGPLDPRGQLLLGAAEVLQHLLVGGRFFQGVQLGPVQVLQQRVPQQVVVLGAAHDRRDRVRPAAWEARQRRSPITSSNRSPPSGRDHDGLEQPTSRIDRPARPSPPRRTPCAAAAGWR